MARIYRYSNKGIKGYTGKDLLRIPVSASGEISTETRHVFQAIANSVVLKTNQDSIQCMRFQQAIDDSEDQGYIEVGEGVYDWLIKKLDEVNQQGFQILPVLFRHNGSVVHEFIKEGFEKAHLPKDKISKKAKGTESEDKEESEDA